MTTSVPVSLGERSYHIHIGERLIESAGALLAPHLGTSAARRVPIITDENVARLHYPAFAASLTDAGLFPVPVVLPPGEQTKSFGNLERVVDSLLSANVERGSLIVALGGGVIGDLTGFAAGVVKRGIGLILNSPPNCEHLSKTCRTKCTIISAEAIPRASNRSKAAARVRWQTCVCLCYRGR